MAPSMHQSLVLLALTMTSAQAQDLVFLLPLSNDAPSSVMSFSSSSVMGSDGQLHTETHKVTTETSMDGKRVSQVDCKDGDCAESMSIMSSMMPSMASLRGRIGMPGMPCMKGLMQGIPESMPGMERMKGMMSRMEGMRHHMMHREWPMQSLPFLAPRRRDIVIMTDEVPEAPELAVAAPPPTETIGAFEAALLGMAGVALLGMTLSAFLIIRSCCFGKVQARDRPLQELGEPLAPEDQAELGVVRGVVVHPQATGVRLPAKTAATGATQSYLLDVYARAAKQSSAKLAASLLSNIYEAASQKVAAATA